MNKDMIDLSRAVFYGMHGKGIIDFPITSFIAAIECGPNGEEGGYHFEFDRDWPDITPTGWDGPLQYTVFVGVKVSGVWQFGGVIQMWRQRYWTGAPLPNNFRNNWCYNTDWWGDMTLANPKVGDEVAFFLAAGNLRAGSESLHNPVKERSNVVTIILPEHHTGYFPFNTEPLPEPDHHPDPHPVPPIPPGSTENEMILKELKEIRSLLENSIIIGNNKVNDLIRLARDGFVGEFFGREVTLKAKQ